jgi:hypothetical protein
MSPSAAVEQRIAAALAYRSVLIGENRRLIRQLTQIATEQRHQCAACAAAWFDSTLDRQLWSFNADVLRQPVPARLLAALAGLNDPRGTVIVGFVPENGDDGTEA